MQVQISNQLASMNFNSPHEYVDMDSIASSFDVCLVVLLATFEICQSDALHWSYHSKYPSRKKYLKDILTIDNERSILFGLLKCLCFCCFGL